MRYFRILPTLLASFVLAALLVGCTGTSDAFKVVPKNKERTSGRTSDAPIVPSVPNRTLKAVKDLKVPDGLDAPVTEIKMLRTWWVSYEDARVGDAAEYEFPGTTMRSRSEVFDLADHAVVTLSEVTMEVEGKQTRTRGAMRLLFVEDEPDAATKAKGEVLTYTRRSASRKFKVGDREVTADTVSESFQGDKLMGRSWQSREMPSAVLQTEDGEGKVTMRLLSYRRGR